MKRDATVQSAQATVQSASKTVQQCYCIVSPVTAQAASHVDVASEWLLSNSTCGGLVTAPDSDLSQAEQSCIP